MSKLCDECETVAHCMTHGCIPKQQALDKMAENAKQLGLDYEPVCNKDPQGCWNVRCQLGKKCKNTPAQQEPVAAEAVGYSIGFGDGYQAGKDAAPQPAQQEPVACQYAQDVAMPEYRCVGRCQYDTSPPAQRKPLTDEEISSLWDGHVVPVFGKNGINPVVFARAIEAAHGIKENT